MKNFIRHCALALALGFGAVEQSTAAIVTMNFSGTVTYMNDLSNAIPAGISYGSPMSGSLTYDTAAIVNGADFDLSTNAGNFYFNTNGLFSLSVKMGSHTFSNTLHTTQFPYAYVITHNDYFGQDDFSAGDSTPYVGMDGGAMPLNSDGYLMIDLEDDTASAFNTDALPVTAPNLAQFSYAHRVEVQAIKNGNYVFSITATITNISGTGTPPLLKIASQPNQTVVLLWPLEAQGFKLLQNTNLAAGIGWTTNATAIVDTALEHTVTLSASSGSMFFRLKSP